MRRRGELDGPRLTYGGPTGSPAREPRRLPPVTAALLVLAVVLLVLLVVTLQRGRDTLRQIESSPAASAPVSTQASPGGPSPPSSSTTPTARPSPTPTGSDATEATKVPVGATEAASRFVQAWLDRDPKARSKALPEVATVGLAESLVDVDPEKIPRAKPVGTPKPESVNDSSATLSQRLSDKSVISLDLAAEPDSRYGWLVYTVSPGNGG